MRDEANDLQQVLERPGETEFPLSSKYLWLLIYYGIPAMAVISIVMTEVKARSQNTILIEIGDRFILNNELSIPTVLSFLLMVMAAQLAALTFFACQKNKKSALNLNWLLASAALVVMAFDEVAQLHERVPAPVFREYFLDHGWIFAGLMLLGALAIFCIPFMLSLPRYLVKQLFTAFAIFFFGAIVLEGIGGFYATRAGKDAFYYFMTTLEESAELVGITYLNVVLIEYVSKLRLVLRFEEAPGRKPW